LAFYRSFG